MLGNGNTNHDVRNTGIREVKVQGKGRVQVREGLARWVSQAEILFVIKLSSCRAPSHSRDADGAGCKCNAGLLRERSNGTDHFWHFSIVQSSYSLGILS